MTYFNNSSGENRILTRNLLKDKSAESNKKERPSMKMPILNINKNSRINNNSTSRSKKSILPTIMDCSNSKLKAVSTETNPRIDRSTSKRQKASKEHLSNHGLSLATSINLEKSVKVPYRNAVYPFTLLKQLMVSTSTTEIIDKNSN